MSRKIIAVDLDDVLSFYAPAFIKFSNDRWGTSLTIDDIDENWAKIWKLDFESMEERAKILHKELFINLDHVQDAKPILEKLSKDYKLVVATSRRNILMKDTTDWLDKYFSGIFDDVRHAGIYDEVHTTQTYKKTKIDLCQQIGADFLIDDQPKHCIATNEAGIKSLLFGEYPWNKVVDLPVGIVRVKSWSEVAEFFNV